jgi:spermidine synthase
MMPLPIKRRTIKGAQKKSSPANKYSFPVPIVAQENGVLTMHFGSEYIQSQMVLDKPDFLALAYTRTMMAFEIFVPKPREIALIGLGGGSMAKWCHRHHAKATLTVIELNPHVIAARQAFRIPKDSQRFRILCEDGAKFVAKPPARFDVLLVDCFTEKSAPKDLSSLEFFDHCREALAEAGLMVVNLCIKHHKRILSRIRKSFEGRVLLFTDKDGNVVVFASKGQPPWHKKESASSFRLKLRKFERKYGLGRALAPRG